jgi:putative tryptophan/tyrosine transport system substrate-binding protein
MNRRGLLRLACIAALNPLGSAVAEQPARPEVGFLGYSSFATNTGLLTAFHRGLAEEGFVDGRNVTISYRSADGQAGRLQAMALELVERKVAVIAATGGAPAVAAAKRETDSIPIVFVGGANPVDGGLASSFSRPGGNVTGVYIQLNEVVAKRFELLRELVPAARRFAVLVNPTNPVNAEPALREIGAVSRSAGIELEALSATDEAGIDAAFAAAVSWRADALFVGPDAFFNSQRARFAELSLRHRLPVSFSQKGAVEAGGLMSYGIDIADSFRLAGTYVGRILKGEKPGDLPVLQPVKYEFAINLRAARSLGIVVPPALLARADEVIE